MAGPPPGPAWLFFPMLLLEGLHLNMASVRALLGHGATSRANTPGTTRLVEGGLLLFHAAANLRRAQALVRAFCARNDIAYRETTLTGSYAQVLRHLHAVGGPLRPEPEY